MNHPPRLAATPAALSAQPWLDHALVDSGAGRKLERYGPHLVVRPEPQCLWTPRLAETDWDKARSEERRVGKECRP